ncbi:hypothetical protein STANM309S_05042 [Streptomyces tanashiensis]
MAFLTPFCSASFRESSPLDFPWSGDFLYSVSTVSGVISLCGPSSATEAPPPPSTKYAPTPIAATTATAPMIQPAFDFFGAGGCGM